MRAMLFLLVARQSDGMSAGSGGSSPAAPAVWRANFLFNVSNVPMTGITALKRGQCFFCHEFHELARKIRSIRG
jgi:hypothetical protein